MKISATTSPTLARSPSGSTKALERSTGWWTSSVREAATRSSSPHRSDARGEGRVHRQEVSTQLSAGLLGSVATEVRRADRLIDLRVRYPDRYRFDLDWIREYPLTRGRGGRAALGAAEVEPVEGAAQLYREDLKQMVPITGAARRPRHGKRRRGREGSARGRALPVGYTTQIGGQYESQQESFRSLLLVLAVALLLVFGLLVAQFRRFTAALVIMSAAPLSLVGAFGLLLLTGTPLNVSSFMGLILLIGLIVKNGIILGGLRRHRGGARRGRREALVQAGRCPAAADPDDDAVHALRAAAARAGLGAGAELQGRWPSP